MTVMLFNTGVVSYPSMLWQTPARSDLDIENMERGSLVSTQDDRTRRH